MGWEQRNGRQYYYRKVRRGRKVTSEYIGAGELAELISELDIFELGNRELTRREWREEKARFHAEESQINQVDRVVRFFFLAHLLASGYYLHKGEWRKARILYE
jgi:hypothetical protein